MSETTDSAPAWTPRFPTALAFALLAVWVVALFLPMFAGQFLGGDTSDQTWNGIPFRRFWAAEFHRTGGVPLWNPFMFGGLPFVGAMHGDMFYPTSFLRAFLRADTTLNLTFFLHLVLAGWFTFLLLRTLKVTWTGSLAGGLSYQLSGIVASLVQPGHDGKLIVSALLPLLLTGLVVAIRRNRAEGYGIVALVAGLDILSPQIQMAQYSLIAGGLFTLWLCFLDEERPRAPAARWKALGLATAAVALGFGLAMIELLPFVANNPFAARTAGARGWEYATSYALPPEHVLDFLVPEFTGILRSYWGSNYFKLHSEYVGAATLALAAVGFASRRHRRLVWIMGGIGALFLLVSLGGHTPFYRLWYAVVPGVKVTRAPGMAFFIPTFVFAVCAGLGVDSLERGQGRRVMYGALAAAAALLLLGASGGLAAIAESLARPYGTSAAAAANADAITWGAIRSAAVLALAAGLGLAILAGRLRTLAATVLIAVVVGGDGFYNARRFFTWSPPASVLYAGDEVTDHIARTPPPYRVLDAPDPGGGCCRIYPYAFLMGLRIPAVLGHHGNELHRYDELLGGKNVWRNAGNLKLLDLLAVRYLVLGTNLPVPGYHQAAYTTRAAPRGIGLSYLFEADSVPPYARVVSAAVKVREDQIVPTLLDPRLDHDRLLLLSEDAPVDAPRPDSLPPRSASRATVSAWEPGAMTIRLDPAPEQGSYLVVSENWYPDWRATVDGRPATTLRGNYTFLSVALPAGASEVVFEFSSPSYERGRLASLASLLAIAAWITVPLVLRRRRA